MDFTEILNNFFGSDWMSSIMTILQSFVLVIVSFLSTKIKAKVNDVTTKYSDNLHKLLEKNNVTTDTLKNATAVLDKLNLENQNSAKHIKSIKEINSSTKEKLNNLESSADSTMNSINKLKENNKILREYFNFVSSITEEE